MLRCLRLSLLIVWLGLFLLNLKLVRYYGLYSRCTSAGLQKILASLSCEKVSVRSKREVVLCSNCGYAMDLVGVTRPDEGGV